MIQITILCSFQDAEAPVTDATVAPTQTQVYRDSPEVVLKCVHILTELLRPRDIEKLSPILRTLLDEFIIPNVAVNSNRIKQAALKAVGGCCLRDAKVAQKHMLLLLQVALVYSSKTLV